MIRIKNVLSKLGNSVKSNAVEWWTTLSIFIGLPLVAWVYLDYRAAIAVFVLASCVIGTLAVRKS